MRLARRSASRVAALALGAMFVTAASPALADHGWHGGGGWHGHGGGWHGHGAYGWHGGGYGWRGGYGRGYYRPRWGLGWGGGPRVFIGPAFAPPPLYAPPVYVPPAPYVYPNYGGYDYPPAGPHFSTDPWW